MKGIIDTHIHIWDLAKADYPWLRGDTSILNRTWHLAEIGEERKEAGIVSGVLVQAAGNTEDTELMLETARNTEWISGVVAWLPLLNSRETKRLLEEKFLGDVYFKGVRHQVHDEEDPAWLLQPAVVESLHLLAENNIPYDVVGILPEHLETVLKLSEKVPGLRMVLDHLNWPPIPSGERYGRWGELMEKAARCENISAKISGLGTASGNFGERSAADIKPYVEFVLERFGAERCFCGGDWPVSMLANSYSDTWKITTGIIREILNADDTEKVLFDNANDFYSLGLN